MAEIPSLVPLHCAFCLKHLPVDGAPTVACARCATPYCSVDCRAKDKTEGCRLRWNEAALDEETGECVRPARTRHMDICGDIARIGLEQYYANIEAKQEALAAVRSNSFEIDRAARDLDEQPTCYICLEGGDGLVRECNCRGNTGFAHLECLIQYAKTLTPQNSFSFRWHSCRNCRSSFTGTTRLALARECWSTYCSEPEDDWRRLWALDTLVTPLSDELYCYPEALRAAEAHLATLQKHFSHEDPTGDRLTAAKVKLILCHTKLGRHAEALQLAEEVYAHNMSQYGPDHRSTLSAVNNLSVGLAGCGFEARRRTLLRDAYERATHLLGAEDDTTHNLRNGLASSLYRAGDAPREDMVEAAALLEISARVARQTYGSGHEITKLAVRFRDNVSSAIDAFDRDSASQRPMKRRGLRLRDVDRRAELAKAAPILNERRISRAGQRDTHAWADYYGKGLTTLGQHVDEDDKGASRRPPAHRPPLIDEDGYVPPPPPPEQSRCAVS